MASLINCQDVTLWEAEEYVGDTPQNNNGVNAGSLELQSAPPGALWENLTPFVDIDNATGSLMPNTGLSGVYFLIISAQSGYMITASDINLTAADGTMLSSSENSGWVGGGGSNAIYTTRYTYDEGQLGDLIPHVKKISLNDSGAVLNSGEDGTGQLGCDNTVIVTVYLEDDFSMPEQNVTISIDLGGTAAYCPAAVGQIPSEERYDYGFFVTNGFYSGYSEGSNSEGSYRLFFAHYYDEEAYAQSPYNFFNQYYQNDLELFGDSSSSNCTGWSDNHMPVYDWVNSGNPASLTTAWPNNINNPSNGHYGSSFPYCIKGGGGIWNEDTQSFDSEIYNCQMHFQPTCFTNYGIYWNGPSSWEAGGFFDEATSIAPHVISTICGQMLIDNYSFYDANGVLQPGSNDSFNNASFTTGGSLGGQSYIPDHPNNIGDPSSGLCHQYHGHWRYRFRIDPDFTGLQGGCMPGLSHIDYPAIEPGDDSMVIPASLHWYISVGNNDSFNLETGTEFIDVWKIVTLRDYHDMGSGLSFNTASECEIVDGTDTSIASEVLISDADVNNSDLDINSIELNYIDDKTVKVTIPFNAGLSISRYLTAEEIEAQVTQIQRMTKIFVNIYPTEI